MGGGWWSRTTKLSEFVFDRGSVAPDADGVITIRRLGPGSDADVVRRVAEIRAELETLPEADRPQVRADLGRPVSAVRAAQLYQEIGAPVVVQRNDLTSEARLPIGVRAGVQITPVKVVDGRRVAVDAADATEFVFDAAAPRVRPDVSSLVPDAHGVVRLSPSEGITDEAFELYVHDAREALNQAQTPTDAQSDPSATVTAQADTPEVEFELGPRHLTAVRAAELGSTIQAPVVVKAEHLDGAHDQGQRVPVDADKATEFVYHGAPQPGAPEPESGPTASGGGWPPVIADRLMVDAQPPNVRDVRSPNAGAAGTVYVSRPDGRLTMDDVNPPTPGAVTVVIARGAHLDGVARHVRTLREGNDPGPVVVNANRPITSDQALRLSANTGAPAIVNIDQLRGRPNLGLAAGDLMLPFDIASGLVVSDIAWATHILYAPAVVAANAPLPPQFEDASGPDVARLAEGSQIRPVGQVFVLGRTGVAAQNTYEAYGMRPPAGTTILYVDAVGLRWLARPGLPSRGQFGVGCGRSGRCPPGRRPADELRAGP